MAKKSASAKSPETAVPTFEESLERLEKIVQQLEQGRLGLGESLEFYEQGVKHLKQCYSSLASAERKIELLAGVDSEGNPITEDFDDAELSLDEKAESRSSRRTRKTKRPAVSNDDLNSGGTLF